MGYDFVNASNYFYICVPVLMVEKHESVDKLVSLLKVHSNNSNRTVLLKYNGIA